jgi:hypothetical protein
VAFRTHHAAFAGRIVQALSARPSGRRLRIIEDVVDPEPWDVIARAARRLHGDNHVVDARTGLRVSAGVVRLANVGPAIRAAHRYAMRGEMDGLPVVVVPYNGSLLPVVRHLVEAALDRCLSRQGSPDPLLGPDSPLRPHIDAHAARGATDFSLVVVTTSLEDTGRDHDLDWAVTEPISERSVIQIGGRIRRHRAALPPDAPANIAMLSRTIRAAKGEERPFAWPGIQDPWRNMHGNADAAWRLPSAMAADLFQGDGFEEGIDAVPVIRPDPLGSPMAAFGRARWVRFAQEGAGDGITPSSRAHPRFPRYCDAHQLGRRFRRKSAGELDFRFGERGWRRIDDKGNDTPVSSRFTALEEPPAENLLVPFGSDGLLEAAREISARIGTANTGAFVDDLLTFTVLSGKGAPRLFWHPAFGAYPA